MSEDLPRAHRRHRSGSQLVVPSDAGTQGLHPRLDCPRQPVVDVGQPPPKVRHPEAVEQIVQDHDSHRTTTRPLGAES